MRGPGADGGSCGPAPPFALGRDQPGGREPTGLILTRPRGHSVNQTNNSDATSWLIALSTAVTDVISALVSSAVVPMAALM